MKVRRIVVILGTIFALSGLIYLFQLQSAFLNRGQEFGAYGQYHRVLRVIRAMDSYTIVGHGVRRKLELAHLFHVEEFSVRLRDKGGREAEIRFAKGTPEMEQRDDVVLQEIVRAKYDQAVAKR